MKIQTFAEHYFRINARLFDRIINGDAESIVDKS